MKIINLIAIALVSALPLHSEVIENAELKFRATFPEGSKWSTPQYSAPASCSHAWTSRNNNERMLIHVAVICAPWLDKLPTFEENAKQWEVGVVESAIEKTDSHFTEVGGILTYRVDGRMLYSGHPHHFSRWMSDHNDIQYQITIISEKKPDTENGVLREFIDSFKIEINEPQPSD